jgi:hypothetical protein
VGAHASEGLKTASSTRSSLRRVAHRPDVSLADEWLALSGPAVAAHREVGRGKGPWADSLGQAGRAVRKSAVRPDFVARPISIMNCKDYVFSVQKLFKV